jgi:hypothetical protein
MNEKNSPLDDDSSQEQNLSWEERVFRLNVRSTSLLEQGDALMRDLHATQLDLELSMKYVLWIQDFQVSPVIAPQVGQPTRVADTVMMQIEQEIGALLPLDYRAFISSLGGWGGFVFRKALTFKTIAKELKENRFVLNIFFGVRHETQFDLLRQRMLHQTWIDPALLPIATTKSGDSICLAVSAPQCGAVFLCRRLRSRVHPTNRLEQGATEPKSISLIANTFDEFISKLHASNE